MALNAKKSLMQPKDLGFKTRTLHYEIWINCQFYEL